MRVMPKIINNNYYPIEKLLLMFREHPNLVFVGNDSSFNQFPELVKSYEILLEAIGIDFSDFHDEDKRLEGTKILNQLTRDEFINEWRPIAHRVELDDSGVNAKVRYRNVAYNLTSKGLELVLKLEAHNDAERRHNDTHKHNTLMRWIAGSSFLLSLVAVSVSAYLAYIANQNMQLNQQRLEIQQQQIKSLGEKVHQQEDQTPELVKTKKADNK